MSIETRLTNLENQTDKGQEIETVLILPTDDAERPYCVRDRNGDRLMTEIERQEFDTQQRAQGVKTVVVCPAES